MMFFLVWSGTESELLGFHSLVNNNCSALKFTMEFHQEKMIFLHVLVLRTASGVETTLYRKPTDSDTILYRQYYHPVSLKRSLPISQFSYVRRICSSNEDFHQQSQILSERFRKRSYREEWIQSAVSRFKDVSQQESLVKKTKKFDRRVNCYIQYSPVSKDIDSVLLKHWHIVESDPNLKKCFDKPPRLVYKKTPNLRNILVRADLKPALHFLNKIPYGNYRCGNCQQCNFTYKTSTFTHPHTGKILNIRGTISCKTANVIYLLRWPCGLCYIEKTSRPLKTCISEHRCAIRHRDPKSPVAQHFADSRHSVSTLQYIGIEVVKYPRRGGDINKLLLQREVFWIYTRCPLED
uniref:Helix-turn-helix domain-containing protein n=1 Tax=Cyprinus carpio carpio TaxID=630221 RepID=A0A9J7YHG0_CYPCA